MIESKNQKSKIVNLHSLINVAIIGSGTMGSGIAQVAATAGCAVKLFDVNQGALDKSKAALEATLSKLVEKEKITADTKAGIQSRTAYVTALSDLSDADLVIEAIVENLEVKRKLFAELESIVAPTTILASNTSSLSIASIAASCQKSERVIGIHFFNPAPLMQLVEVIPAVQTSEAVLQTAVDTIRSWKKVVAVAKDTPGFIVNRVARPFYSESLRIYEEGMADFATIDWALKTVGGFRMGPFELMDFIGNDVNYAVTESVFTSFYFDPRYKPAFTQKRLTEAGFFGRKSGRGFYDYSAAMPLPQEDTAMAQCIFQRVIVMLINEAADAHFLNVGSVQDIDNAMTKGVNYPKGLLAWADELGLQWCVDKLDALYDEYREDRYRCSPLLRRMAKANQRFYISD
ncbi:3-hydroxyacyl-CoA dehydrogenase NAD-binding domain-containing protein [Flavobacterium sp.]|jgi:3-hydroxybutyryl-CoA dehydrogenase|uniref:3-hydroxyacyl-CoA dehydrogenase NAD-binding domain-containing protein n=1 Tax=Flavobacterium sp. TaxID=239 RepID=UPI0022BBAFE3|nr:3-hydroxyacyl-CoA dehydrogenase NAD-binding domain-containing protein [Flavobacterium sp.]MCZ8144260.1 3-hydroxyacyl-CoA dehydrogenase NAD-binding domain-containing protein [Flavobacterium sp.]MCZ8367628.1 3-hydroxyacyl-CoA dehydrogenase NAD-binding domain-containing protein [Flavobacterium sp.]